MQNSNKELAPGKDFPLLMGAQALHSNGDKSSLNNYSKMSLQLLSNDSISFLAAGLLR
jgi:hypothetical protein